jgi:hypothetical protein
LSELKIPLQKRNLLWQCCEWKKDISSWHLIGFKISYKIAYDKYKYFSWQMMESILQNIKDME